jgi:hypothetical protein
MHEPARWPAPGVYSSGPQQPWWTLASVPTPENPVPWIGPRDVEEPDVVTPPSAATVSVSARAPEILIYGSDHSGYSCSVMLEYGVNAVGFGADETQARADAAGDLRRMRDAIDHALPYLTPQTIQVPAPLTAASAGEQ